MNTHYLLYPSFRNTGKRRIQFLIHKSSRIEKVIGKKSQSGLLALLSFLFVRGPNGVIETACFDANVQYANVLYKVRDMWERSSASTALYHTFTISKVNLNLQYFYLNEIWKSEVQG